VFCAVIDTQRPVKTKGLAVNSDLFTRGVQVRPQCHRTWAGHLECRPQLG